MVNNPTHKPFFLSRRVSECFSTCINEMVIKHAEDNTVFTNDMVIEQFKECIVEHTKFPIINTTPEIHDDTTLAVYDSTDKLILGKPDILLATNPEMAVYYAENNLLRWAERSAANNYIIMAEGIILLMAVQYYLQNTYAVRQGLFYFACKTAIQNELHNYIVNNQLYIPNIFELPEVQKYCNKYGYDPQLFKQKHLQARFFGGTIVGGDFTFLMFFGVG